MVDMISTPPRQLTFCERLRMTFWLLSASLRMQGAWIKALWRSGATVSFLRIGQQSASVVIESGRNPRHQTIVTASRRNNEVTMTTE